MNIRLLAQSPTQLSIQGTVVGFFALASLILLWFSGLGSTKSVRSAQIALAWTVAGPGCLAVVFGPAGIIGACLGLTVSFSSLSNGWDVELDLS